MLGFAHDWANREATLRSWDLVARYVIPEINGTTAGIRESQQYLNANQAELMAGASKAVVSKILEHEKAAAAMATTMEQAAQAAADNAAKGRSSGPAPASRRPTDRQYVINCAWPQMITLGDRVRGPVDVHLRFVLGDLHDAAPHPGTSHAAG